jgi:transcriptional regulator with XRE-family HTH domain
VNESTDLRIARRLQQRRWDLGLSTYKLADRARDHGFTNCTAKIVSQIENGERSLKSRDETRALANALETTRHWVESGHGEDGQPVIVVGSTAVARIDVHPDDLARIIDRTLPAS